MLCGSPSSLSFFVFSSLFVILTVIAPFHIVDPYQGPINDSGIYYERYPLHKLNSPEEQLLQVPNQTDWSASNRIPSTLGENGFSVNCTEPTIQDFPNDMFTQEQRRKGESVLGNYYASYTANYHLFNQNIFIPSGGVVVHFILCIYTMLMIGVVIDEYFVPSLEIIAEGICIHFCPVKFEIKLS